MPEMSDEEYYLDELEWDYLDKDLHLDDDDDDDGDDEPPSPRSSGHDGCWLLVITIAIALILMKLLGVY